MPNVRVVTVKGDKEAEKVIRKMLRDGWELDQQSSRKVAWSMSAGLFTKKQKHTLTFIRSAGPQDGVARTPAGWYPHPDFDGSLGYWDGFVWTHRTDAATKEVIELGDSAPDQPQDGEAGSTGYL